MKTFILVVCVLGAVALSAPPALAQQRADIKGVQQALAQAGHDPGAIDGVVGPKTSAALKAYQRAHGLSETGRPDEETLAKLQPAGGDTQPSPVDPAQANKSGANVGEGAAYNRSTEKK